MTLTPGQVVDRFELVRLLGTGGMAEVWLVRHRQLGSLHALKVLVHEHVNLRARILQEGRVQATLRHDGIVTVTDVIDVEGMPGLVMEYVEGTTLRGWLDAGHPIEERIALFLQVAEAVAAAHDAGLVHRDLKPENVLVEERPEGPRAKVTDFGLVKQLGDTEGGPHTREGVAMGTPRYMAPEQIRDSGAVDHRADVFALAAILYELATGELPHGDVGLLSIFERTITADREHPRDLAPDLPDGVVAAIERGLAADPDERLPDVRSLIRLVTNLPEPGPSFDETPSPAPLAATPIPALDPVPPEAAPEPDGDLAAPEAAPPTGREGRRRRAWVPGVLLAAAFVVVLLIVGMAVTLVGDVFPDSGPTVAADPDQHCVAGGDGTVGWARTTQLFFRKAGQTWVVGRDRPVFRTRPTADNDWAAPTEQVCVLPRGSEVVLAVEPERAARAAWVRVDGAGLVVPAPGGSR